MKGYVYYRCHSRRCLAHSSVREELLKKALSNTGGSDSKVLGIFREQKVEIGFEPMQLRTSPRVAARKS
jgi:hypothetical protein